MGISLIGLLRTGPGLKYAIEAMTKTPGALESKQNWVNLIKCLIAVLAICGFTAVKTLTDADISFLGDAAVWAALGIPWLLDGGAQIWLRIRKPDSKAALANRKVNHE